MTTHNAETVRGDPPQQVAPGLWRLPVPLPGHSVGHVNAYAFLSDGTALVVDTGWEDDDPALEALLEEIGIPPDRVERVLATHCHVDHCGRGRAFQRRYGARVAMHGADAVLMPERYFDLGSDPVARPYVQQTLAWSAAVGLPPDGEQFALEQVDRIAGNIAPFTPDDTFIDGDHIRFGNWELIVLHTPGHTAGHCCFYETSTGALLTGDHVFPRIMASPTYRPQSPENAMDAYIGSLDRLERLDVAVVLPGHQEPFEDLGARLDEVRAYHRRRMERLCAGLRDRPLTVHDVCAHVAGSARWRARPWRTRLASIGESYGHLLALERRGVVERFEGTPVRWRSCN